MAFGSGNFQQQYQQQTGAYNPQVTAQRQQTSFNNSPYGAAFNAGVTNAAPSFAQYDAKANSLLRGGALETQGYGYTTRGLNLGYESDMGDLNERMANNQVDLRAAGRQPGLIDQLLASQNRDFDISRVGLGTNARRDRYQLDSDATAKGSYRSGGTNKGRQTIYEQLQQGMGHIDESQTQNTLNQEEQKKQAQDRMTQLTNTANNLGMKPAQLKSQLELGLQKAGLAHLVSANDLLDGLTQNDLQSQQLLNQIVLGAREYATMRTGKVPK